jgi:Asp/Glu/hydantoin racemase
VFRIDQDKQYSMKIAIIHTTTATVEPLKALAAELLPGWGLVNFVDDSILPQLAENGGDLAPVAARLVTYARFAEQVGAAAVLEACSSVGEAAAGMQAAVSIPVVRIDQAMAEEAVRRGGRIGVAATLSTTLNPTLRLLRSQARLAGKTVELEPLLVEDAYRLLMAGDQAGHDVVLASALLELSGSADVVVLAQASMARVLPGLPESIRGKFLSSPRLGMLRLKETVEACGV